MGRLAARPSANVSEIPVTGKIQSIGNGAHLYVPTGLETGSPAPLLLLFPGTNGSGSFLVSALQPYADRHHFLLLGFSPVAGNFDSVDNFFDDLEAKRGSARKLWPAPRFGADVRRIDKALARVFQLVPVDRARIGVLGFSHGASYALTLGTANPELFASIQALSPGILIFNPNAQSGQSIFLAHGTTDPVQPYRRTACSFAPRLAKFGYRVDFAPFKGGHSLPPEILDLAVMHFVKARHKPRLSGVKVPEDRSSVGCRPR